MNTQYRLAYFTGLIDGEGHICVFGHKNGRGEVYQDIRIIFVQSEKNNGLEVCNWIKDNYQGTITYHKVKKEGHSNIYRWSLSGKKAVELCQSILPMSIIKRNQISSCLDVFLNRTKKRIG